MHKRRDSWDERTNLYTFSQNYPSNEHEIPAYNDDVLDIQVQIFIIMYIKFYLWIVYKYSTQVLAIIKRIAKDRNTETGTINTVLWRADNTILL